MKAKALIVLIGHKARNGKDTLAKGLYKYLNRYYKDKINYGIIHWADALYEEVNYDENYDFPLLFIEGDYLYLRHNKPLTISPSYMVYKKNEMPKLYEYAKNKKKMYFGMKEKDPILLQLWGTNFRRNLDQDWWVKKGNATIKKVIENSSKPVIIMVPDTRFKNELENAYKGWRTIYIEVERYVNNKRYIDPNRDKNHPSEIELDFITDLIDNETYYLIRAENTKSLISKGIKIIKPFIKEMLNE